MFIYIYKYKHTKSKLLAYTFTYAHTQYLVDLCDQIGLLIFECVCVPYH